MNTNEVLIKFETGEDDKMKISWNLNPDTKIEDLFFAFDSAKSALTELVNKQAKKNGIKSEKAFFKWLKDKSIRDIS